MKTVELRDFYIEYKNKYGSNELDNLFCDILNKKDVNLFDDYPKKRLYSDTVNLIIDFFSKREIIAPKAIMLLTKKSLFRTIKKNKKAVASVAIASSLLLSPLVVNLTKAKKEVTFISSDIGTEVSDAIQSTESAAYTKNDFFNEDFNLNDITNIYEVDDRLNNLNLTDDDKIYKDCPLSAKTQWFIVKMANERNIPSDFIFAIIDKESDGNFNTSGVASHINADGSIDYGLTQQNSRYSIPAFSEKYGVNYENSLYLVKQNDYANIIAFCDTIDDKINIINNIRKLNGKEILNDFDVYLIASNYNGGASPSEFSKDYARSIEEMMSNKYNKRFEEQLFAQKKKR